MARPRTHDDALKSRLLEVASRVISESGATAVTVRSVASSAGTSASAVYALFGSREKMLEAVRGEAFRRFAAHLAAVPRTDDAVEDLRGLGRAYRASALADPHFYHVMFDRGAERADDDGTGGVPDPPGAHPDGARPDGGGPDRRSTFGVLRDAVARVLAGAPPDRVETVAIGLWGLAHGLVSLELAGRLGGDATTRERRYTEVMESLGPALTPGRTRTHRAG